MILKVNNLKKHYRYDDYPAIDGLSFDLADGEIATLALGIQGGKTTLAKILTGIEKDFEGEIFFDGKPLTEVLPQDRDIAFFTYPPLFLKGKVKDNIAFGLKQRKADKATVAQAVKRQSVRYGLTDLLDAKVKKLSVSDAFKVSLARAFARKVRLAVFDDVLGRDKDIDVVVFDVVEFCRANGIACLFLTNNITNALGKALDFVKFDLQKAMEEIKHE